MASRKRITIALVGLILLVVIGWFVREFAGAGDGQPAPRNSAAPAAERVSSDSPSASYMVVDFNG